MRVCACSGCRECQEVKSRAAYRATSGALLAAFPPPALPPALSANLHYILTRTYEQQHAPYQHAARTCAYFSRMRPRRRPSSPAALATAVAMDTEMSRILDSLGYTRPVCTGKSEAGNGASGKHNGGIVYGRLQASHAGFNQRHSAAETTTPYTCIWAERSYAPSNTEYCAFSVWKVVALPRPEPRSPRSSSSSGMSRGSSSAAAMSMRSVMMRVWPRYAPSAMPDVGGGEAGSRGLGRQRGFSSRGLDSRGSGSGCWSGGVGSGCGCLRTNAYTSVAHSLCH